jgi:hypothetical protein
MPGAVAGAVGSIASGAVSKVKGILGIHSPSKVFAGLGMNVGQGFAAGISGMRPHVDRAISEMVGARPAAVNNVNDYVTAGSATRSLMTAPPREVVVRLVVDGDSTDPFVQWLRRQTRILGQGDVQKAWGVN